MAVRKVLDDVNTANVTETDGVAGYDAQESVNLADKEVMEELTYFSTHNIRF